MKTKKIIEKISQKLALTVTNEKEELGTQQHKIETSKLSEGFKKHLTPSYNRFSKIKTLLYRDRPVDLNSHYVSTNFKMGGKLVVGNDIIRNFIENRRNIISGTAGSGKSVLLKHVFISLLENDSDYMPFLIELRSLISANNDFSIHNYIYKSLKPYNKTLTEEQLMIMLNEGKIVLLLDGFDEIDYEKKEEYEREILDISTNNQNLIMVVSSRPDDVFSSWEEFHIFNAEPLNQSQSIDLISRIEYDETVKKKFIKELSDGLYEKHEDFLSNPLLLTMMLLTYEQLAEIPEKIHIFYEQAFDTLYHKHDALKSLYKRKSYCGLPIDDFKTIFSAFCIITLSDRKITFSYQEIIDYLKKSITLEEFNVDEVKFFNDLIKSVCIIQKDGNTYTFSHRSFQEYFSAYYLSRSQSIDIPTVLDRLSSKYMSDSVIKMLFELNKEKVETLWIIPRLEAILKISTKPLANNEHLKFISLFYDGFCLTPDGIGLRMSNKLPMGYIASYLHILYPDYSAEIFLTDDGKDKNEKEKQKEEEVKIFMENTGANPKKEHDTILIADMTDNIDWLSRTWIPQYCSRKQKFMTEIYNKLNKKYTAKETNLSSILFH